MEPPLILSIDKNRSPVIETDEWTLETGSSFDVVLQNEGVPIHAYIGLSGDIASDGTIVEPNRFLDQNTTQRVKIRLNEDTDQANGAIKIVLNHGQHRASVGLKLNPEISGHKPDSVQVDEELSYPPERQTSNKIQNQMKTVIVALITALGLLSAMVSSLYFSDHVVWIGAVAVIISAAVAFLLLIR